MFSGPRLDQSIDAFNEGIVMIVGGVDKGKTNFYNALKLYSDRLLFLDLKDFSSF